MSPWQAKVATMLRKLEEKGFVPEEARTLKRIQTIFQENEISLELLQAELTKARRARLAFLLSILYPPKLREGCPESIQKMFQAHSSRVLSELVSDFRERLDVSPLRKEQFLKSNTGKAMARLLYVLDDDLCSQSRELQRHQMIGLRKAASIALAFASHLSEEERLQYFEAAENKPQFLAAMLFGDIYLPGHDICLCYQFEQFAALMKSADVLPRVQDLFRRIELDVKRSTATIRFGEGDEGVIYLSAWLSRTEEKPLESLLKLAKGNPCETQLLRLIPMETSICQQLFALWEQGEYREQILTAIRLAGPAFYSMIHALHKKSPELTEEFLVEIYGEERLDEVLTASWTSKSFEYGPAADALVSRIGGQLLNQILLDELNHLPRSRSADFVQLRKLAREKFSRYGESLLRWACAAFNRFETAPFSVAVLLEAPSGDWIESEEFKSHPLSRSIQFAREGRDASRLRTELASVESLPGEQLFADFGFWAEIVDSLLGSDETSEEPSRLVQNLLRLANGSGGKSLLSKYANIVRNLAFSEESSSQRLFLELSESEVGLRPILAEVMESQSGGYRELLEQALNEEEKLPPGYALLIPLLDSAQTNEIARSIGEKLEPEKPLPKIYREFFNLATDESVLRLIYRSIEKRADSEDAVLLSSHLQRIMHPELLREQAFVVEMVITLGGLRVVENFLRLLEKHKFATPDLIAAAQARGETEANTKLRQILKGYVSKFA